MNSQDALDQLFLSLLMMHPHVSHEQHHLHTIILNPFIIVTGFSKYNYIGPSVMIGNSLNVAHTCPRGASSMLVMPIILRRL